MPPVRPSDFARLESEHGDDPVFQILAQFFQDQEDWRIQHNAVHSELAGSMHENTAMTRESLTIAKETAAAAATLLDIVQTGKALGRGLDWVKKAAMWIGSVAVAISACYGVYAAVAKGVVPSIGVGP